MGKRLDKLEAFGDRISNLPDVVLSYILSFVSTKDAVATCVLSTRWKPLWASVPTLDLSDSDFLPRDDLKRRKLNFLAFISKFLMENKISPMTRFLLKLFDSYDPSLIESWISFAKTDSVKELQLESYIIQSYKRQPELLVSVCFHQMDLVLQHECNLPYNGRLLLKDPPLSSFESWMHVVKKWNIKELELDLIYPNKMLELPDSFPYEILVVLKLQHMILDLSMASVCFPNLKVLILKEVAFENGISAFINSSCPVLEELDIERSGDEYIQGLAITSHTLRRLSIRYIPGDAWYYEKVCQFSTEVSAPNLQYFGLQQEIVGNYFLTDLRSLVEAEINCSRTEYDDKQFQECLCDLLKQICHTKYLMLSDYAMKGLEMSRAILPTFRNLTSLKIHVSSSEDAIDWKFMLMFLKNVPMLKNLTTQAYLFDLEEDFELTSDWEVPSCLVTQLEMIEFYDFTDYEDDAKIVQFFLKNSKALKKMRISSYGHDDYKEKIKQAISAFPEASSTACMIEFD